MDGIPETLRSFHDILISIWEEETMPQYFKDARLSPCLRTSVLALIVAVTEVSRFCTLLGRCLHESSSIA